MSDKGSRQTYKEFFDEHHIQGSTNSSWAVGLLHEGELVSCLSIRSAMKHDAAEIARFCHKKFYHIPGGISRLLKYAIAELDTERLITYADLMHGDGSGYGSFGFEFSHRTVLNYWYTDFVNRYPRHQFQATEHQTERELAEDAGVKRIYGAGNYMFELDLEEEK